MRHLYFSLLTLLTLLSPLSSFAVDAPKHEIRAVWLTTIYGLDWPSRAATSPALMIAQQKELDDILDRLSEANFNTIFVQVRLRGDVIYRSTLEPMSRVFSGRMGVTPGYDPLAYAIKACHKRGMECHAWFVTFPLGSDKTVRALGKKSIVRKNPRICVKYKGEWLLNPSVPETADYLSLLVRELVSSYDIDGIHFDYIRYPEHAKDFPDKTLHRKHGGQNPLEDWRRANISRLVSRMYDEVKALKPWVQVSSSTLGKYNRIEANPHVGWTAFESVYQDPQLWVDEGKQDMLVPMMYYLHDEFFPFVDNWVENANNRMIVPGLGIYRMEESEANWTKNDILNQIDYVRSNGGSGAALFRCEQLLDNTKGLYTELKEGKYRYPAQLFPLTWLNDRKPHSPERLRVEHKGGELKLSWNTPPAEKGDSLTYTVYYSYTDSLQTQQAKDILITGVRNTSVYFSLPPQKERIFTFAVSASTRYHVEGAPSPETFYYFTPLRK